MLNIIHVLQIAEKNIIGKSETELNVALIHETFKKCYKNIFGLK